MMQFTADEMTLMMLYNPGTRLGMLQELREMQTALTGRDRNLRKWTASVLVKLESMTDEEFAALGLLPDAEE